MEQMLQLNKKEQDVGAGFKLAPTDHDREFTATDAEINNLVYELYGITHAEREIIAGG